MDFFVFGIENLFHRSHELQGQVAVVQNNPLTCLEALLNQLGSGDLLFLSHRDLSCWELLLLLCEFINGSSWIGSCG